MKLLLEGSDVVVPNCDHAMIESLTTIAKSVEPSAYSMFLNGNLKLYFTTVAAAQLFMGRINRSFELFVGGWSINVAADHETGLYTAWTDNAAARSNTDAGAVGALMIWHAMTEARENATYYMCRDAKTHELYVRSWDRNTPAPADAVFQMTRDQYMKVT